MTNNTLIFNFADLSDKDKSITLAKRHFEQAGATVTSVDVDPKMRRIMSFSYRDVVFGFADSQSVVMSVKATGDVYQVKLNGRLLPLKHQDDHLKAIGEIVAAMAKGRAKFQAALAKVKVTLPKGIRTAAPKMEVALRDQIKAVDEAIGVAQERLTTLRAAAKETSTDPDPEPEPGRTGSASSGKSRKGKNLVKASESKKDGADIERGRIRMAVEGPAADVRLIEKILDRDFTNDLVDDEDADGKLEIGYLIDRQEKADFMAAFKAAKDKVFAA